MIRTMKRKNRREQFKAMKALARRYNRKTITRAEYIREVSKLYPSSAH